MHLRSRLLACLLVPTLLAGCGERIVSRGEGPDVVVLVVDTLRADRLPFYGHDVQNAPFLSELAERGVVFERAWSTSSWTAPATASLFTSLYPSQHGVTQGIKLTQAVQAQRNPDLELNRIPGRLETLPEVMRGLGYRTFAVTDNPNVCEAEGFRSGFHRFRNFGYEGAENVNRTLRQMAGEIRDGGKWFVYLHYMDPHFPYHDRRPWFEPPPGPRPPDVMSGPIEERRPWIDAAYDSEIRFVDEHIREAFEMLGVDEETVVVFVADHGEELLQRGPTLQHAFKLFSELTHVPLVVFHPGVEPVRKRVSQNVSLVDVLPTLRDILGAPPSEQDAGRSLVPYYTEPAKPPSDRPVFSMRSRLEELGGGELLAVVRGDDKLIRGRHDENGEVHLLFDLEEDWAELRDRAEEAPGLVGELEALWEEFRATAPVFDAERGRRRFTEDEVEALDDMGYVETDEDR